MRLALAELSTPPALRERLEASFLNTADWMRNTP